MEDKKNVDISCKRIIKISYTSHYIDVDPHMGHIKIQEWNFTFLSLNIIFRFVFA